MRRSAKVRQRPNVSVSTTHDSGNATGESGLMASPNSGPASPTTSSSGIRRSDSAGPDGIPSARDAGPGATEKNAPTKEGNTEAEAAKQVAELLDGENAFPLVSGVLAVKVVSADVREATEKDAFVFARLRVRNITKYTENAKRWGSRLAWGEMAYFPLRVIRDPRHPFNLFQVDIIAAPHHVPFNVAIHNSEYVLGSVPFHVHDLVKGAPSAGSFSVLKCHRPVGNVSLEIYFTYGAYGYGYSPQFQDTDSAERKVEFSMLPRSTPATKEPWSQTLVVAPSRPLARILDDEERAQDFPLVTARMKRLDKLRSQYDSFDSRERMDKLAFLYKQINSTSAKQSMSTPPIFIERNVTTSRSASFFKMYMKPALG